MYIYYFSFAIQKKSSSLTFFKFTIIISVIPPYRYEDYTSIFLNYHRILLYHSISKMLD